MRDRLPSSLRSFLRKAFREYLSVPFIAVYLPACEPSEANPIPALSKRDLTFPCSYAVLFRAESLLSRHRQMHRKAAFRILRRTIPFTVRKVMLKRGDPCGPILVSR